MLIRIKNWEKYNPRNRKDIKHYWWFKFNNAFFEDEAIFELSSAGKLFILYCFCSASKQDSTGFAEIHINFNKIRSILGVYSPTLWKQIDILERVGIIEILDKTCNVVRNVVRNVDVTQRREENITEENITEQKNINLSFRKIPPSKPKVSPKRKKPLLKFSAEDSELAQKWLAHAFGISPKGKFEKDKFADAIRKSRELMKFSHQEMEALFKFIINDDFWNDKAYSPLGLTKKSKSNEQPKIANIAASAFKKNREWKNVLDWAREKDRETSAPVNNDDSQPFDYLKNS